MINFRVPVIALAQLFGTSLWFNINAAASALHQSGFSSSDIGWLTGATQIGFIVGTLVFAATRVPDRFFPSRVFALCSVLGAVMNLLGVFAFGSVTTSAVLRFLVGVSLAGIYPVGMKLMVRWAPKEAGMALSLLVGMLTLGTASSHALRTFGSGDALFVLASCSLLAVVGAALVWLIGDPPIPGSTVGSGLHRGEGVLAAFRVREFRASAFGYFGHMWELYAFWTLLPLIASRAFPDTYRGEVVVASIAIGAFGCWTGGYLSRRVGSAPVALAALTTSGACCFLFATLFDSLAPWAMTALLLVWGLTVIADSPQFSAMSAAACPPAILGSALAIQNSIGFAISTISIVLVTSLFDSLGLSVAWILLPGPVAGIVCFFWTSKGHRT